MVVRERRRRGFTLIELLVVIVIVALLAALLLPALLKALCNARQGAAKQMLEQLTTACSMYKTDWAVFPPGDGKDSVSLVSYLSKESPKKQTYFNITQDMLQGGSLRNPVWVEGGSEEGIVHYRNNQPASAGGSGGAGGGANKPPTYNRATVDIWCAGCDFYGGSTTAYWSVNNWE